MGFFSRLFGPKEPPRPPRDILGEVLTDIGLAQLIPKALRLFDKHESFVNAIEKDGQEALDDDGEPLPDEQRAALIFRHVLEAEEWLGHIDWATGVDGIAEEFDRLFAKLGILPFPKETREQFVEIAKRDQSRGSSILLLWDRLGEEAKKRGLFLHWWHSEEDAHFPLLLKTEAYQKWSNARFGKGFDVLP